MLCSRQNDQHGAPFAVIAQALTSAEDPIAVLPQDLTVIVRIHAVQQYGIICHISGAGLPIAFG
jgi:hypothetical protein